MALAGQGCGDPVLEPSVLAALEPQPRVVRASDALYVLQSAVGSKSCAVCVCDVNRSRTITASDALLVLKSAVGQPVILSCFACVPLPMDAFASYPAEKEGNDTAGAVDAGLENGATFGDGILGLGFSFDGVDDRVVISHDAGQNPGNGFTVSAWIKADSYGHGRSIAQKRTSSNLGGFTFETTQSPYGPSQSLSFVLWFEGVLVEVLAPADVISNGTWHHAVANYDGAKMKIFVDGEERASRDETRMVDASTEPVVLGSNVVASGYVWDGAIDEVEFFQRALTDFEVRALYLQGRDFESVAGLAPSRLYRAENNSNDSASETSVLDGVLHNGAGFGEGRVGRAFQLDGINDFAETPAAVLGSATDVTVAAWIRTTDTVGAIVSLAHGTLEDELLLLVGDGRIAIFNHKSSGNYTYRLSDSLVNDGNWTFVAGVLDGGGAVSNLKIYVNGVEETGTTAVAGTPSDIVDTTPRSLRIGWRGNEDPPHAFGGLIDEVSLFDHVLSAAEILALFEAGRGPTP